MLYSLSLCFRVSLSPSFSVIVLYSQSLCFRVSLSPSFSIIVLYSQSLCFRVSLSPSFSVTVLYRQSEFFTVNRSALQSQWCSSQYITVSWSHAVSYSVLPSVTIPVNGNALPSITVPFCQSPFSAVIHHPLPSSITVFLTAIARLNSSSQCLTVSHSLLLSVTVLAISSFSSPSSPALSLTWLSQILNPDAEANWTVLRFVPRVRCEEVFQWARLIENSHSAQGQICKVWAWVCFSAAYSQELYQRMSCFQAEHCSLFSPAQLVDVVLFRFVSILFSTPVCFELFFQQHLGFAVWGVGGASVEVYWQFLPVCLPPCFPKHIHMPKSTAALLCCAVAGCICSSVAAWWEFQWILTGESGALTESLWVWQCSADIVALQTLAELRQRWPGADLCN